jgi:hypothetical protein
VALFGRGGDASTVVELVDWFTLDIRDVDLTSRRGCCRSR